MPRALQVVTGRVTNPSTTITALTANTGDSFTVRNSVLGSKVRLLTAWAFGATAGLVRVRSPLMHDANQGLRLRYNASNPDPLTDEYSYQLLYPQDALTFEMTGGASETDMASLLLEYDDLPGAAAQLATWDEIRDNIEHLMGCECAMTTGGTAAQYGGSQAVNASFDNFRANRWYAILGYLTDTACGTIGVQGPDLSNLRVAGPGSTRNEVTAGWYVDLAAQEGAPRIPVFNSANKAGTLIDIATPATSASINVTLNLALLSAYTPK